eukprot:566275-Prorocentrum_minimum.AAC.1
MGGTGWTPSEAPLEAFEPPLEVFDLASLSSSSARLVAASAFSTLATSTEYRVEQVSASFRASSRSSFV